MVAMDSYGCYLLGEAPERIPHLREAAFRSLGTFEYRIIGGTTVPFPTAPPRSEGWKEILYKLVFRAMYVADLPLARLVPGHSLVPAAHYWLGIRPHIITALCDRCGLCASVCPVNAIDVDRHRIVARRCMHVRCLRCVDACPKQAIALHGWRRP